MPRRARELHNWLGRMPERLWAPLAAGALMLALGAFALVANHPWVFPSLGPTIYMLVHMPGNRMSRPFNVLAGNAVGIAAGIVAVILSGSAFEPPVTALNTLLPAQMWGAVIAVMLTLFGQLLLRAVHPPAASTTLLIVVGGFHVTVPDILTLIAGLLLVEVLGEPLRRMRLQATHRQ